MFDSGEIIDISQPVQRSTACFPGDTPFNYIFEASYQDNNCYNLTSFKMSPHVGTHADAPAHVKKMAAGNLAGDLPLAPFIGPCHVVDLSPRNGEIRLKDIEPKLKAKILPRILFRTRSQVDFEVFDEQSAHLSVEVIDFLNRHSVRLIGIDTPSVDAVQSKSLDVHHALIHFGMVWLENLDLSKAKEKDYFLSALPLKLMELEAAPVRAVLLPMDLIKLPF